MSNDQATSLRVALEAVLAIHGTLPEQASVRQRLLTIMSDSEDIVAAVRESKVEVVRESAAHMAATALRLYVEVS